MLKPDERAEAQALYRGAKDKPSQLAIISQMYPAATQAELNDALGTTMADWPNKRGEHSTRMNRPRWTNFETNTLKQLVKEGKTDAQIAKELGLNASSVQSKRQNLGLQINRPSEDSPAQTAYQSRRHPDLERLIYRAFLLVDDLAVERGLPIETEWRGVLGMLEQALVDLLPTVWAHPDTEDYVIQIAALSAADDWAKKTAPRDGSPNEAKG